MGCLSERKNVFGVSVFILCFINLRFIYFTWLSGHSFLYRQQRYCHWQLNGLYRVRYITLKHFGQKSEAFFYDADILLYKRAKQESSSVWIAYRVPCDSFPIVLSLQLPLHNTIQRLLHIWTSLRIVQFHKLLATELNFVREYGVHCNTQGVCYRIQVRNKFHKNCSKSVARVLFRKLFCEAMCSAAGSPLLTFLQMRHGYN